MCQIAKECGAFDAVPCHHWSQGGLGSVELAQAVEEAARTPSNFQFLYDTEVCTRSSACRISVVIVLVSDDKHVHISDECIQCSVLNILCWECRLSKCKVRSCRDCGVSWFE